MPDLGTGEIIIIAIVILILFGSAKLPQAARSLGRSMRIFKSETKGLITDEEEQPKAKAQPQEAREQAPQLEQQAPQGLPAASEDAISGVPVSKAEQGKQS
jgi:sec-independent protein translocase protein TatA